MIQENPTFIFKLTLEEANYILAGLQELPGKICNPLSEKIKTQAQEQINAMQAAQPATEKLFAEPVE
jgi:hypothetical protein